MPKLNLDLASTPISKIQYSNLRNLSITESCNILNDFTKDLYRIQKETEKEIVLVSKVRNDFFMKVIKFDVNENNLELRLDNIYYKDNLFETNLFLIEPKRFSAFIHNKEEDTKYKISSDDHEGISIEILDDKNLPQITYSISNKSDENYIGMTKKVRTVPNSDSLINSTAITFSNHYKKYDRKPNELIENVYKTSDVGSGTFVISLKNNECQFDKIVLTDNKITGASISEDAWNSIYPSLSKKMKDKSYNILYGNDFNLICKHLETSSELNQLVEDITKFKMIPLETLAIESIEYIKPILHFLYITPDNILQMKNSIIEDFKLAQLSEKRVSFGSELVFNEYKAERAKNNYTSLSKDNIKEFISLIDNAVIAEEKKLELRKSVKQKP